MDGWNHANITRESVLGRALLSLDAAWDVALRARQEQQDNRHWLEDCDRRLARSRGLLGHEDAVIKAMASRGLCEERQAGLARALAAADAALDQAKAAVAVLFEQRRALMEQLERDPTNAEVDAAYQRLTGYPWAAYVPPKPPQPLPSWLAQEARGFEWLGI